LRSAVAYGKRGRGPLDCHPAVKAVLLRSTPIHPSGTNALVDPSLPADQPDLRVFSYAVAEKAWLYVPLVEALMMAKERFALQLRPVEVAGDLPGTRVEDVADALEALERWGNVQKFYDTSAPETLDQFYAKRFLYQLTDAGVAAHQGVRAVGRAGLDSGRLSAVLLPGIIERLAAVQAEAEANADGGKLYRLLLDLFGTFGELADNAARYMNDLAVETTTITTDDESFAAYKRAVFAYLNEFIARLADAAPEIATAVARLEPFMPDLIALAAATDAAPVLDGEDEGVPRSFTTRWEGVRAWFLPRGDAAPIVESLRLAMLDALNRILAAVGRLHERHLRRVTREADFTQLARWFAIAPSGDAGLLWDRAFGLYSARHFAEPTGDEELDRGASFWHVEPAAVAPRLRATGARAGPGRPGRADDYSAVKLAGLAQVRELHRQAQLAIGRVANRTPARLSDLGVLDVEEFAQFLVLVDAALSALPADDGSRTSTTPLVTVTLCPVGDGPTAVVTTPRGRLECPDYFLEIVAASASRRLEAG
jgi:uncharacterized protein (TIGR02677 family)